MSLPGLASGATRENQGSGASRRDKSSDTSSNTISDYMRRTVRSRARAGGGAGVNCLEALPAQGRPAAGQDAAPAGRELPTELFLRVLELLPPNEQALSGRLACRDAARRLSTPRHRTVRCDQPMPEHAADQCWQRQLLEQARHMTFKHKLQLMSTVAASGCEANVCLAWGVLRPCVFMEMASQPVGLQGYPYGTYPEMDDPGTAAIKAGHEGMIAWLVANGCPLDRDRILQAAALHSSLDGMQHVWDLLPQHDGGALGNPQLTFTSYAAAAARSCTSDACAKVCWLLDKYDGTLSTAYLANVLTCAAKAGRFDVVRHVYGTRYGRALDDYQCLQVLQSALLRSNLAVDVADWLVDERGLRLPTGGDDIGALWLWRSATEGGSVDALRWLRDRGVPLQHAAHDTLLQAVQCGRLEPVHFLLDECGLQWTLASLDFVRVGSVELAAWLMQHGRLVLSPNLYSGAAACGTAAMVQWLLQVAHCPFDSVTAALVLCAWPCPRPGSSRSSGGSGTAESSFSTARDLLRALQLLEEAGCRLGRLGEYPMAHVARHGDMELARWVVQQVRNGRWPEHAMQCIVKDWPEGGAPGSRLRDAMRMVLEAGGSPGSCRELEQAARRGDLEALRLLHGQGQLRLGRGVWVAAVEGGCEAVLEWLAAEDCRVGTDAGQDPYLAAGRRGDRCTLCVLQRLGVPWGHRGVLRAAVDRGVAPPVVRWMVEAGAPWDGAAVAGAAEAARRLGPGHEATAVWLEQQGSARGAREAGGAGSGRSGSRGSKRRR